MLSSSTNAGAVHIQREDLTVEATANTIDACTAQTFGQSVCSSLVEMSQDYLRYKLLSGFIEGSEEMVDLYPTRRSFH